MMEARTYVEIYRDWIMRHWGHPPTWGLIPGDMRESLCAHLCVGRPVGHFLTAVLSNDLYGAAGRADPSNAVALADYAKVLYNDAPPDSFGSLEKVTAWRAKGGLGLDDVPLPSPPIEEGGGR
jgi:hypothetical protein